jgi:ribosomal protein L11 methylase PrmA
VEGRVRALAQGAAEHLAASSSRYDLVLANLLAPEIRDLGTVLARAVTPGGALVVSGLLADRWREPVRALLAPGSAGGPALVLDDQQEEDGWVALVLRHP